MTRDTISLTRQLEGGAGPRLVANDGELDAHGVFSSGLAAGS